jgi:hypothetical protein
VPKVFRNTVAITRQLGVATSPSTACASSMTRSRTGTARRHEEEDVHHYGLLNIAATAAEAGEGGLFFDRNPLLVHPLKVTVA